MISRPPLKHVAACALILTAGALVTACSPDDPDDVAARFASMEQVAGDVHGATTVTTDGPATLWALTRRDDLSAVAPADCSLGDEPLSEPMDDLNLPEPADLDPAGTAQTLFAFASRDIGEPGSYTVTCDLDASVVLFLVEPTP